MLSYPLVHALPTLTQLNLTQLHIRWFVCHHVQHFSVCNFSLLLWNGKNDWLWTLNPVLTWLGWLAEIVRLMFLIEAVQAGWSFVLCPVHYESWDLVIGLLLIELVCSILYRVGQVKTESTIVSRSFHSSAPLDSTQREQRPFLSTVQMAHRSLHNIHHTEVT